MRARMMWRKVSSRLPGESSHLLCPGSDDSLINFNNDINRSNPLYEENMKTNTRNGLQRSESSSSGYSSGAAGKRPERSDFLNLLCEFI